MSKLLSPKAWYLVGIGAVALAADGTRRMIKRRRRRAEASPENGPLATEIPVEAATNGAAKQVEGVAIPAPAVGTTEGGTYDLTQLKGIGPTYARRLVAAGYTTFADIASATADELRDAAKAPRVANPEEWIAQAKAYL